jgi:TolB-like protein
VEKSIAILPFENLSSDKDNAYFTDGVQDEILTDLAKIAELKVISRTSVMQYKSGAPRNLREDVDGMLTLRASKVVVFVRKRSLMCKGSHWRRGRNARFSVHCSAD